MKKNSNYYSKKYCTKKLGSNIIHKIDLMLKKLFPDYFIKIYGNFNYYMMLVYIKNAMKRRRTILHILLAFFTFGIGNIIFLIYRDHYFKSYTFLSLLEEKRKYIQDCNELNIHIEELKNSFLDFKQINYGKANYTDNSNYNYKRPEMNKNNSKNNIYNCTSNICKNAKEQPFKYLCKYFDIPINEETLNKIEKLLNDYSAVEQGKVLLSNKQNIIISEILEKVPFIIGKLEIDKILSLLNLKPIDFNDLYFPKYTFQYISPGGNAATTCDIIFNIENLESFVEYLSKLITFKKSIAGQRALMTTSLRKK